MDFYKKQTGFTLIELLVVIIIIGILVGLVGIYGIDARKKAFDAQKKADMHELQGAIEMHFADMGSYPVAAGWQNTLVSGDYLNAVLAARGQAGDYTYTPSGSPALSYDLTVQLENLKDTGPNINNNGVFTLTQKQ